MFIVGGIYWEELQHSPGITYCFLSPLLGYLAWISLFSRLWSPWEALTVKWYQAPGKEIFH